VRTDGGQPFRLPKSRETDGSLDPVGDRLEIPSLREGLPSAAVPVANRRGTAYQRTAKAPNSASAMTALVVWRAVIRLAAR
jgi:hypothetical protein